jgi:hypothetical protein
MKITIVFCYGLFLTTGFAVEAQELLAPTNVTLVGVSPQALRVQFTDTNTTEDIYVVYHSSFSPHGPFEEEWAIDGSTDAGQTRSLIFGGYEPLTTVYVQVVALDMDENTGNIKDAGPPSELLVATTLEFYQAQPTDFKAESQGSHIRLTWTDTTPAGSEGDEFIFQLMRAGDGGVNYTRVYTLPANTTSFKDTDVQPNTVYTYRLDAENEYGVNGQYLLNFASASLKHQKTLVYPNPTALGTVTVNLDNQYNKGTVKVEIVQPVVGIYYSTTVSLRGSKFTLDAFSSLPPGSAYHLILTLPDGNVVTTIVFNREN